MEKIAHFSKQTIIHPYSYDVHFGDDTVISIPSDGDIVSNMHLRLTWPSDAPSTVHPSAGTAMIDFIELIYDQTVIERIYGENMYMLNDLSVPVAKRSGLSNLVGTYTTSNLAVYYIQLPFSIFENGLPLLALDQSPKLRVVFRPSSYFSGITYSKPLPLDLCIEYVMVSEPERNYFKNNELYYTVHTWQRLQFKIPASSSITAQTFLTEFVGDVKELFWVIQGDTDAVSNVYNYGTQDSLINLSLSINNNERITPDYASGQYLRVIQGLQYHTRVPDGRYYMYSFALQPQDIVPSGSINMSNISRQQHVLNLTASPTQSRTIRLYGLSYNIFRVGHGIGHTMFTLKEGGIKK